MNRAGEEKKMEANHSRKLEAAVTVKRN